jgi:hypothetical protein
MVFVRSFPRVRRRRPRPGVAMEGLFVRPDSPSGDKSEGASGGVTGASDTRNPPSPTPTADGPTCWGWMFNCYAPSRLSVTFGNGTAARSYCKTDFVKLR